MFREVGSDGTIQVIDVSLLSDSEIAERAKKEVANRCRAWILINTEKDIPPDNIEKIKKDLQIAIQSANCPFGIRYSSDKNNTELQEKYKFNDDWFVKFNPKYLGITDEYIKTMCSFSSMTVYNTWMVIYTPLIVNITLCEK